MISLQEFQVRGTTSELVGLRQQLGELLARQHTLNRSGDRAGLIEITHRIEALREKIAAVRHIAESNLDEWSTKGIKDREVRLKTHKEKTEDDVNDHKRTVKDASGAKKQMTGYGVPPVDPVFQAVNADLIANLRKGSKKKKRLAGDPKAIEGMKKTMGGKRTRRGRRTEANWRDQATRDKRMTGIKAAAERRRHHDNP
jgi:TolA-binding protein